MEDKVSSAEAYDDLTSLFLPDILHNTNASASVAAGVVDNGANLGNSSNESSAANTNITNPQGIQQDFTSPYPTSSLNSMGMKSFDMNNPLYNFGTPLRQDELTSFNTFITNNDFISNSNNELSYQSSFPNYNGNHDNENHNNSGKNNSSQHQHQRYNNNSNSGGNNVSNTHGGETNANPAGLLAPGTFLGNANLVNGANMESVLFNSNIPVGPIIQGNTNVYGNSPAFPMGNASSESGNNSSNNHNNSNANGEVDGDDGGNSYSMVATGSNNSGSAMEGGNNSSGMQANPYINHYANYVPIEAAAAAAVQQQRQHLYPVPQQLTFNPELVWYGNNQFEQGYIEKPYVNNPKVKPDPHGTIQDQQIGISKDPSKVEDSRKSKLDKKKLKQEQLQDTDSAAESSKQTNSKFSKKLGGKLTRLLDFKPSSLQTGSEYSIIDASNNEIKVSLSGFLNGRFYTNEVDNRNYYRINVSNETPVSDEANTNESSLGNSSNESKRNAKRVRDSSEAGGNSSSSPTDQPPKILSCYRRNFIQLSLNLNLSGFTSKSNKVLKLQNSKFGYTVTRVIKWFKIDILANTNFSNVENVPMMILVDKKDKAKKLKKEELQNVKQDLDVEWLSSQENIIHLNDEETSASTSNDVSSKREIDKYFAVKKLQFKSATPNNGKLSFQNYYNLIIRLSAVVADPYYDDYVDDFSQQTGQNSGSNSNEVALVDLVSEPMIVRGRNPSFYGERNDILIKSRSPNVKESYKVSHQLNQTLNQHANSGSAVPGSALGPPSSVAFKSSVGMRVEGLEDSDVVMDGSSNAFDIENDEVAAEVDAEDAEDAEEVDEAQQYNSEEEDSSDSESDTKPRSIYQPYSNQENIDKSIPPIVYSATSSSSINLKSMLNTNTETSKDGKTGVNKLIPLKKAQQSRYKYFPVSNVYYLPPINVVYFPHGAHQTNKEMVDSRESSENAVGDSEKPHTPQRRKSSNVYFR